MGVHSLWEIVGPSARPVRLEALSRRKLAVDASIWIYQFLKAMRDKDGNALHNSHIVGFFRRICKLLYFGIQPVFVFDGGAPVLKKRTIGRRKERRRDKLETLQQTALKLLSIQLQKRAEEDYKRKSQPKRKKSESKETKIDENKELEFANYYEDFDNLGVQADEKADSQETLPVVPKKQPVFRKDDDYHLPDLEDIVVGENDQRMITDWEFKRLTEGLEDELDGIDLDTIDPTSEAFHELPIATQYMVLSHLRLRSRLRMGYTKEQLDTLFPNRMDFSKFQISMVQKRNFLTQKLMNINGMDNVDIITTRRVAGERGREYQLMKNDDGYTLSLPTDGNSLNRPIELDEVGNVIERRKEQSIREGRMVKSEGEEDDDDEFEFEDVPVENGDSQPVTATTDQISLVDLELMFSETENKMVEAYKMSNSFVPDIEAEDEVEKLIKFHKSQMANKTSKPETVVSPHEVVRPTVVKPQATQPMQQFKERKDVLPEPKTFKIPEISFKKSMLFSKVLPDAMSLPQQAPLQMAALPLLPLLPLLLKTLNPTKDIEKIISHDDLDVSVTEQPKPKEKAKPAPNWFTESQVGFGKSNPYNTDYSIYNKESTKSKDEEMGLMSFEQAREYLADEVSNEESDKDDSDVEIIEPKAAVAPVQKEEHEAETVAISDVIKSQAAQVSLLDYDFSESEEEDLIQQLEKEEQEHERFTTALNNGQQTQQQWTLEDEKQLQDRRNKEQRDADEVTLSMIQDVQELLSRFGIPFITAPMEAEAQCATLYQIGLVDGIITDDSDCFLFGGDMIYKNMFNEKNYVECYRVNDIENDFGLNRDKMIELAVLLGSDYTEGIKGVGKVTLMEILAEFGNTEESSLVEFRNWWMRIQMGAKLDDNETSIRKKLRKTFLKKLFLDNEFPDPRVIEAYLNPEVDKDETQFVWGTPDLDRLRTFLTYSIGWNQQRIDEVLVPVIKDINKKKQTTLEEFFPKDTLQKRRELMLGKRLKNATTKLSNKRHKK